MDRVLALDAGSRLPPGAHVDPIGQDIRTQWALSWKIVVSEWRSVIAVSLNVGGCVRLIKPAKLYMFTQNTTNTTRTDARRRVCAAMVPYTAEPLGERRYENWNTHTHTHTHTNTLTHTHTHTHIRELGVTKCITIQLI